MNKLTILALIFGGVLLLSVITKRAMSESYDISCEDVAAELTNTSANLQFVELTAIADIIKNKDQYQIVDLRTKQQFDKSHIENAVNLPVKEIVENKSLSVLKNSKVNILYSDDYSLASNINTYLKQIGYTNVKYLQANYSDAEKYIKNPANFNPRSVNHEVVKYNYNMFFNQPKKTAKPASAPVKKVKRASGGC